MILMNTTEVNYVNAPVRTISTFVSKCFCYTVDSLSGRWRNLGF